MSAADKDPGHQENRPTAIFARARGNFGNKTFAELFCERFGVQPENYARSVLRRTLYPQARLAAPLLRILFRDYFEADFDFIAGIGRLRDPGTVAGEVSHFQRHPMNRGCLRHRLGLRVSASRMLQLVEAVMGEGSGPATEGMVETAPEGAPRASPTPIPAVEGSVRGRDVEGPNATGVPIRILCVEDHVPSRKLYRMVFERAGYVCQCVGDGREAYELLAADPRSFDVVMTDHEMPHMDGLELVRLLRRAAIPVEIIVVSGSLRYGECQEYEPLRVGQILCKPLTPRILLEAVAKVIRKTPFD